MKSWLLAIIGMVLSRKALAVAIGVSIAFPPGAPAPPGTLALTRTFNNPLGSTSSSSAFKMIGEPFKAWPTSTPEVPPGNALTASWQTAAVAARIGVCRRKYDAERNLSMAQVMVDATAAAIPSGSSDTLVFTSAAGAFGNTTVSVSAESAGTFTISSSSVLEAGFAQRPIEFTGSLGGLAGFSLNQLYYAYYVSATTFTLFTESGTQIIPTGTYTSGLSINLDTSVRTDADWIALHDTMTIANVTTYSTNGPNMNAGPYTATFDGGATNTITVLCTSPVGREVQVAATMLNSGSVAHCYIKALMDYWVPQTSAGAAGPIESIPVFEHMQIFKGTADGCNGPPGEFTADLSWSRNGTLMRQFLDVPIPPATIATLARPDGNWDYASSDPGFVVTQDYTLVDATYKTPPYIHGIVYTGASSGAVPTIGITAVNTTTGLFSTATSGSFITINPVSQNGGTNPNIPISIQFTGSAGNLTGLSVCAVTTGPCSSNAVYWTCAQNTAKTQFWIFDDEFDAFNCTAGVGQIIPGGSYGGSGLSASLAAGPESNGGFQAWGAEGTGGRPDLNLMTEWGTASILASNTYTAGTTSLFQTMARAQAWSLMTMPTFVVDKTTNRTISFLDAAHTPTALGTAKTTSWYRCPAGTTDINGGAALPGGTKGHPDNACGLWEPSNSDHAAGNPGYPLWVLEGNPYFERAGTIYANEGIIAQSTISERNAHNSLVGGGATYYAVPFGPNVSQGARGNAWNRRDILYGREFADDGSAEEQVFTTEESNDAAAWNAYYAWKQSAIGNNDWHDAGLFSTDDVPGGLTNQPYNSNFMTAFGTSVAAFSEQLVGDFLPAVNTFAQNIGMFQEQMFANTANFCEGFGDTYNVGNELVPINSAAPGRVTSNINDVGAGASETFFAFIPPNTIAFYSDNASQQTANIAPYTDNSTIQFAAIAAGDQYRPFNTGSEAGQTTTAPPSNLTQGQDYPILNPAGSGLNAQLNNGSGSPITFTAGPGVQQAITNATWVSNTVAITVALDTGLRATNSDILVVLAGLSPSSLNVGGIAVSAALRTGATAATWASNQVTFTTSSANVPIQPGDTFTTSGFSPSGYNGTFTAAAGTGGNTVIAALLTNPGTVTTKGNVNYPSNEFTYTVTGSGTPTFSGATETPLDGGTLIPTTYKGANCPATGLVHSGPSPAAGSYGDQIRTGICFQTSVQAAQGLGAGTWGVACTNVMSRITGGGFNGLAAFALGPAP